MSCSDPLVYNKHMTLNEMSAQLEAAIYTALRENRQETADACEQLCYEWVTLCDRSAPVEESGVNDAHAVGMGLAVLCCRALRNTPFCWKQALQNVEQQVLVPESFLRDMT